MQALLKTNYDTLCTSPERGPEFYLARHRRRKALRRGEGRLGRFRDISKYVRATIADVIRGRLDPCFTREFRFYEWNVLTFCAYCNARLSRRSVTRDHVIPRSRGGSNEPDNLVPCCRPCNARKSNKPLWQFLLEREVRAA